MRCKDLPQSLTHLDIDCYGRLPGSVLKGAERLTNLQVLILSELSDVDPHRFSSLPTSLKVLKCEESDIDDRHIKNLSHLTRLEKLSIAGSSKVTGNTFSVLPHSLIKLNVRGVLWFNDIDMSSLPPKLKWIKSNGGEIHVKR